MRSIPTLLCALASGALLVLPPAALAQDAPTPGEILGGATDAMLRITQDSAMSQRASTHATLTRLEALDAEGAPDAILRRVARQGVARVRDVAGTARSALNAVASRATRALEAIDAPAFFSQAVLAAREAAGERLRHTTRTCSEAIRAAMDELVDDKDNAAA